jgi:hypothetical protein
MTVLRHRNSALAEADAVLGRGSTFTDRTSP